MLAGNFSVSFFLKTPRKYQAERYIYLRIIVDGKPAEISISRKCPVSRWNQNRQRMSGDDETAQTLNHFLELIVNRVHQFRNELFFKKQAITSKKLIDHVTGRDNSSVKVVQEFQKHNEEMLALVKRGEYAFGTYERFEISKKHLQEFLRYRYQIDEIDFRDITLEFIKNYEFYLKTVKNISNNTALKYITNFKKVVLIGIDLEIITHNPFKRFKTKKIRLFKKPLSREELHKIEHHNFDLPRLSLVRDIFVFQCYTGLSYADTFNLKWSNVSIGIDGTLWLISERQKTGRPIHIPLLPKAHEIIERYRNHPMCHKKGSLLPISSNQKMNAYLKEIADICGINCALTTHKARRTFASTVTLANDVPIHIVKEMLGHHSIQQTEEYAVTEQQAVGREMQRLRQRLAAPVMDENAVKLAKLEAELMELRQQMAYGAKP
ncbi:site-specific integrase [Flavobacterium suzhouense]|uniref:Site-specific integrase n=1 Tax=Flavobacterium suzhouense TaxID=1529638 RepID=A0ABW5NU35_9FLAO